MFDKHNFFINTYGCFKVCKAPKREPDYVSYDKQARQGAVSSKYWYGVDKKGGYVIRYSKHWSIRNGNVGLGCKKIANCFWELFSGRKTDAVNKITWAAGKCYFSKMKENSRPTAATRR